MFISVIKREWKRGRIDEIQTIAVQTFVIPLIWAIILSISNIFLVVKNQLGEDYITNPRKMKLFRISQEFIILIYSPKSTVIERGFTITIYFLLLPISYN